MEKIKLKNVSVSVFIATSLIVIFCLYLTVAIKTLPCGKDLLSVFLSNFVHIDLYHLISNLFALYALSRVEREIGIKRFLILIIFLLTFTSIFEVLLFKLNLAKNCSIGFSGILFGVMTWELIINKELDIILILSIISMLTFPSIKNSKISFVGHSIGVIVGVITGIIWKNIIKI